MNRMTKLVGYGAAALLALASCSRESEFVPPSRAELFSMTVTADDTPTKTLVSSDGEGGYNVTWQAGDDMGVYEVANGAVQPKATSSPLASAGSTASFTFTLEGTPDGPYDYTFVSPASALGLVSAHYAVTLPAEQTFAASSFDPAADVLVSETVHADVRSASVSARMARLGGTARMSILAPDTEGETVQKIIFSTTEASLAGSYQLNPATGEVADEMLEGVKSLTLTPAASTSYDNNAVEVWFRLAEVTLTDNFTVSVVTSEKTYTKTLYLGSLGRSLEFRNSVLTTFGIDMRAVGGVANFRTDVINSEFTGNSTYSYVSWSNKPGSSSTAVYAGHTATRSTEGQEIGLHSDVKNGMHPAIFTTSSAGKVKSVFISAKTDYAERDIDVYAKNTPYASPEDLWDDESKGELIGTVHIPGYSSGSGTVDFDSGDYAYLAIRVRNNSVDISEIRVTWEGAPLPDVTTGGASAIHAGGATLAGSFASAPGGIYEAGFYWDTSASDLENLVHPDRVITTDGTAATSGDFSCDLGSLNELTTYYYRAYVLWLNTETNTYEEYLGEVCTFSTVARDYSVAGWLELPAYTVGNMAGTTPSSLADLYHVTHKAEMNDVLQRNYTLLYDPEMLASYWVAYPLCSDHLTTGRTDSWGIYDPRVPSGKQANLSAGYGVNVYVDEVQTNYYARGHQIPNADRNAVPAMQKQTYYPTNITPQLQNYFNGGIWMDLEAGVRSAVHAGDTVYVVTGAAFRKKGGSETINIINPSNSYYTPGNSIDIPVPNYYWKVLLKVKRSGESVNNAKAIGFWLEHRDDLRENTSSYQNYAVSVDQIEAWTGFDFFANLPEALQNLCEDDTDWADFRDF